MLLIKNFDQFLDALNLCETGIYTYEEVISTTPINPMEVEEFAAPIAEQFFTKTLLERKYFTVSLISIGAGDATRIDTEGRDVWLKCIQGEVHLPVANVMLSEDDTYKLTAAERVENDAAASGMVVMVKV